MVAINFQKSYDFMQIDERGRDDDPDDRGGRTCDGVTQDEYAAWCHLHNQPTNDVWDIQEPTKQAIFHLNYWHPWCDRLPNAIDYLWFDVNVNSGAHEATLILQRALGFNTRQIDGSIGLFTVQRAVIYPDKIELVTKFTDEHKRVYDAIMRSHPSDVKYRQGWYNRIHHETVNATAMLNDPSVA